jgi:hypothetical protein
MIGQQRSAEAARPFFDFVDREVDVCEVAFEFDHLTLGVFSHDHGVVGVPHDRESPIDGCQVVIGEVGGERITGRHPSRWHVRLGQSPQSRIDSVQDALEVSLIDGSEEVDDVELDALSLSFFDVGCCRGDGSAWPPAVRVG